VNPNKTIHTSRTLMFSELAKVMDFAIQDDNYLESLKQNVINKKTKSGIDKTSGYLKTLYGFDLDLPSFIVFKYFWQFSAEEDKPIFALLYAIGRDYLLAESIYVIAETKIGEKVTIENMERNIEIHHPDKYSEKTRRSIAQNIASSWKQAEFILGKVKNIRTQPSIGYNLVAFAFCLAYLEELRGDFILSSKWVKALSLSESDIRNLAIEASKRDLMQYQFGGDVTSISFSGLFKKLGINAI